jgi:hypothetical protein
MPPKVSGTRVPPGQGAGDSKDSGTSGKQGADFETKETRIAPKGAPSGEFDASRAPVVKKGGY